MLMPYTATESINLLIDFQNYHVELPEKIMVVSQAE